MKVVFDAERLRNLGSGLGQFSRSLGQALIATRPPDGDLTFIVPPGETGRFAGARSLPTRFWMRYLPPAYPDVWHATHQDYWIRPPRSARMVLSIMDLNFLERADYSAAKKARRLAAVQRRIDRAAAIATISEFTATVVRRHLTVPDVPLRVIHLGNPLESAGGSPRESLPASVVRLRPGSYFLFVGVIHPKKNVRTLVPMLRAFPEMSLVLAGSADHAYAREVERAADAAGVADRLVMPGWVSDETRHWLYANCRALLFPSLSEGFGLPVVEAMSLGKPAFLSQLTSLPEIGGEAAYYFDSFDPDSMIEVVRQGLADFDAHPGRAAALRAHAARFSWTRAATEYWGLYAEALRSPRR